MTKVNVFLPRGLVRDIRDRVGKRRFDRYVAQAVERQLALVKPAELVDGYVAERGPFREEVTREVTEECCVRGASFVLTAEALSQLLRGDEKAFKRLGLALAVRARVVVSALSIPEAGAQRVRSERLDFVLSRLDVQPVTEAIARDARQLLMEHGLGRRYAVDAMVAATALRLARPVAVHGGDLDDARGLFREVQVIRA